MTHISPDGMVKFLGLSVGRWTGKGLTETLCKAARDRQALLVTYLNAHNVNIRARDRAYDEVLNRADILYADGMSIVWASRLFSRRPLPERVNAGDFLIPFCRACAEQDLSVFLLGSEPRIAKRCARRLLAHAPALRVAGATDGFWGRGGEYRSEAEAVEAVRRAKPDILLVGMGVPRQELWAARRAADLGAPVIWCVGALFEYYSGQRGRAPVWMRRTGLEWVFRLALEPRRLARRYLWGNLEFAWRVWRATRPRRSRAKRDPRRLRTRPRDKRPNPQPPR